MPLEGREITPSPVLDVWFSHFQPTGTANGHSTELIARYFGRRLQIVTIDFAMYGDAMFNATRARLARYPNVKCLKGDSTKLVRARERAVLH